MAFKDWIGQWVELRQDLVTHGGRVFPKGMHMLCDGVHRGCLSLTIGPPIKSGQGYSTCQPGIRKVRPNSVTALSGPPPETPKQRKLAIRFNIEFNKAEGAVLRDILDGTAGVHAERLAARVKEAMRGLG